MPTHDVQRLLTRLYTDEAMLAEFLADRDGFCRKLTGAEASFFEQIDRQQLEFFAGSLRNKRAHEAEKLLPLTASALGRRFHEAFRRYSATCVPAGARKHAADVMAFCEHLLVDARGLDSLLSEAARYELLSFRMHFKLIRQPTRPVVCQARLRPMPWLRLAWFAYELPALTGSALGKPWPKRSTLTLFVRIPGLCGIWYW